MQNDGGTDAFLREVGARLQAARKEAGLSLQDAAHFLGLSRAAVGHWEKGTNPIDLSKLHRLARRYDTTVVALVAGALSDQDLLALTKRQLESRTKPTAQQESVATAKKASRKRLPHAA